MSIDLCRCLHKTPFHTTNTWAAALDFFDRRFYWGSMRVSKLLVLSTFLLVFVLQSFLNFTVQSNISAICWQRAGSCGAVAHEADRKSKSVTCQPWMSLIKGADVWRQHGGECVFNGCTSPLPHLSCKCSLFSQIIGQISNLIHKIRQIFHIYWSWNWCKRSCNQWDFPHNEDYWGSAGGKVWRRWRHRLASQQVASEIARFPSRDSVFPYRRHSRRQGGHQGWGPGGGEAVWKLWAEGNQSNEREFTSLDLLPWCLRKITLS